MTNVTNFFDVKMKKLTYIIYSKFEIRMNINMQLKKNHLHLYDFFLICEQILF